LRLLIYHGFFGILSNSPRNYSPSPAQAPNPLECTPFPMARRGDPASVGHYRPSPTRQRFTGDLFADHPLGNLHRGDEGSQVAHYALLKTLLICFLKLAIELISFMMNQSSSF